MFVSPQLLFEPPNSTTKLPKSADIINTSRISFVVFLMMLDISFYITLVSSFMHNHNFPFYLLPHSLGTLTTLLILLF